MYSGDSDAAKTRALLTDCAFELKLCAYAFMAFALAAKTAEKRTAYWAEVKRCDQMSKAAGMVAGLRGASGSGEVAFASDEITAVAEGKR